MLTPARVSGRRLPSDCGGAVAGAGSCSAPAVRAQAWARSMKATASPTVLRFLASSSGIETPNFSSQA